MNKIQVLSQAVADKIAAGEVAERPAAVVKELVENAIDAGADRIAVEIKKGGVAYIRVTDNGGGIPEEQVETAFLRHATSKLSEIEDLFRIGTMGFRGEALASICAVAEVEVITKTPEAEEGTYLELVHGVPGGKEPIACGDGTTMVVKNLFANVPARMKFLKKDSTEAGYVSDLLGRIALSRPEIAFSYICDGKEVFATSGDGRLENVVLKLYGLDHAKALIPVDYTEENIHISGVIGKPEIARGNRTRQTLFVNGRYVKNHVVAKVAEEAYRNTIMVGRFPFFVIQISLPPELVDVNVHPAKTEIKFANEKQIYDIAYHAIRNAVCSGRTAEEPPQGAREERAGQPESGAVPREEPARAVSGTAHAPRFPDRRDSGPARVSPGLVRQYLENTIPGQKEPVRPAAQTMFRENGAEQSPEEVLEALLEQEAAQSPAAAARTEEPPAHEQAVLPGFARADLEEKPAGDQIVGQVFDTYIICQAGDEMFLIDQHAAHERLRFEKLREAYLKKERLSQMLLTPAILTLDFQEKQAVMENLEQFRDFGFEIEDFGGNAVIVHGTPVAADEQTIRDLVLEIADALREQVKHPVADFEERALDMISCKYAIKANKRLSLPEMQDLVRKVQDMERAGVRTCPHGRPIKVRFTKTEIEKLFKRKL